MTQTRIPAAAAMIRAVEWSNPELRDGPATNFNGTLLRFLSDDRPSQRDRLWFTMEESVFSQGYVFNAAEPTIAVLLASLLDDLADPVRIAVLDLLFLLTQGAYARHDQVGLACMERIKEGAWLLSGIAISGPEWATNACLEILDCFATACVTIVRTVLALNEEA